MLPWLLLRDPGRTRFVITAAHRCVSQERRAADEKMLQGIFNMHEHKRRKLSYTHTNTKSSTLRPARPSGYLCNHFILKFTMWHLLRGVTFPVLGDCVFVRVWMCAARMACQLNCVRETKCFDGADSRVSQCDEKVNLVVVSRATLWLKPMPTPISWDYLTSSRLCDVE